MILKLPYQSFMWFDSLNRYRQEIFFDFAKGWATHGPSVMFAVELESSYSSENWGQSYFPQELKSTSEDYFIFEIRDKPESYKI